MLAALVVGSLGLWLVLLVVRKKMRASARAGGVPADGVDRLSPALLGSMFGVAAGHWVYDQLFRDTPRSSTPVLPELLAGPPPESPETHAEGAGVDDPHNSVPA